MDINGTEEPVAAAALAAVVAAAAVTAAPADDAADLLQLLPPLPDDDSSSFEVLDLLGLVEPMAAGGAVKIGAPCDSSSDTSWEATAAACTSTGLAVGIRKAKQVQRQPRGAVQHCSTENHSSSATADGLHHLPSTGGLPITQLPPGDEGDRSCSIDRFDLSDEQKYPITSPAFDRPAAGLRDGSLLVDACETAASARSSSGRSRLVCSVCGDHARGYNFGAIACESCKAFFRRTVQKSKVARCQFEGSCVQTVKTRRFCPACRLSECLKAGMNKSLVRGEEEKNRLRRIINCNREKKKLAETASEVAPLGSTSDGSGCGTSKSEPPDATSPASAMSHLLTALPTTCNSSGFIAIIASDSATEAVASSVVPEQPSLSQQQSFIEATLDELRQGRSSEELELSRQLRQLTTSVPEEASVRRYMPPEQWAELAELGRQYSLPRHKGAGGVLSSKCGPSTSVEQTAATGRNYLAYLSGVFIRRFVAFSRNLPEFCRLPLKLQMHLLKVGAAACLTIYSAEKYCPAGGCWFDDQGQEIPREMGDSLGSPSDSAKRTLHFEMVEAIRQQLPADADGCTDKIVVALLQIIVLLSPENMLGAIATDSVSLADVSDAQQHYIVLLRHYVEAKYSYTLAAELVPELIRLLSLCKRTAYHLHAMLLATEGVRDDPLLHEVLEP